MLSHRPLAIALAAFAASVQCDPTSPQGPEDAGPCPEGCPSGEVCRAGYCVDEEDPCGGVVCRQGTLCVDGVCVEGGTDGDGDGHPAGVDCDDGDAEVHPGAAERCNGEDDDCDGDEDEDLSPRPCSTPCGAGTESCVEGRWSCDVPSSCECPSPGTTEDEPCGRCGRRERSCGDDWRWGDWGPCEGDVDCPVVCGDDRCEPPESCESCEADCGSCCPVEGHMGDGEHGDTCSGTPETWRCVHSASFDDWISQVCRGGIWQTYAVGPRDCEACCETFTAAACDAP